jgi:predicted acetyltransferase
MRPFAFYTPGNMEDRELELVLNQMQDAQASLWQVPAYLFHMRHRASGKRMGNINLRIGNTERILLYTGHIGYGVDPAFRGNHYAERACRLLLPLAFQHGMTELWITCAPDNLASRRTIERLGAQFIETVDVPDDYPLPEGTIRQKSRFRIALPGHLLHRDIHRMAVPTNALNR